MSEEHLSERYKPLSPWAYFGYHVLFDIPVIGFILLIVYSIDNSGNINRRNFARSYWCVYILYGILILLFVLFLIPFFPQVTSSLPTA